MRQAGYNKKSGCFKQNIATLLAGLLLFGYAAYGNGQYTAVSESLPFFHSQDPQRQAYKYESGHEKNVDTQEAYNDIIGIDDITFETDTSGKGQSAAPKLTADVIAQMENIDYLKKYFYLVDSRTQLLPGDIRAKEFLAKDLSIDQSKLGPKVLIFHTHSSEGFIDSDMSKDMNEGIWGAGERLKQILESQYGIKVLHDTGQYDKVDGKGKILGAYERMEPNIQKILADNPTIEVVIDMHRDGLPENVHLVTEIDGKPCAKIMFFNGLCRLNKNGEAQQIAGLTNPNLEDNLAFSLQMQAAANHLYPDFTRRIYLNAYRYSLHMKPKSLLIEVGSQMNTKAEVHNAMEPLAKILAQVLGAA